MANIMAFKMIQNRMIKAISPILAPSFMRILLATILGRQSKRAKKATKNTSIWTFLKKLHLAFKDGLKKMARKVQLWKQINFENKFEELYKRTNISTSMKILS
jgi:hypothetical protein